MGYSKYLPRHPLNRAPYFGGTIHVARGKMQVAEICTGQPKIARLTGQRVRNQD